MKRGTRRALLVLGTILAMGIILAGTAAAQSQGGSFRIVRPEAPPADASKARAATLRSTPSDRRRSWWWA